MGRVVELGGVGLASRQVGVGEALLGRDRKVKRDGLDGYG